MDEVDRAVQAALAINGQLALLQCNTNYTASLENFKYIQLNVLKCYRAMYPGMVLGLSDHTPGHATVLGAVALGARIVEKHFTDDIGREGPDHGFSMSPATWRDMVVATRELENALGSGIKRVEENEKNKPRYCSGVPSARRARWRPGADLTPEDLIVLRPCPPDAISAADVGRLGGKRLLRDIGKGEHLRWSDLA